MPTVKWCLGLSLRDVVEDRLDHRRREFLRRQAVAAGDQARRRGERRDARRTRLGQRRRDVEIERIAGRARLLRPIQDRERADGLRQRGEERLLVERAIEPDLQHADLFAASGQVVDRLVHGVGARSHDHDHALGGRIADVLEQAVVAAGQRAERLASSARRCRGRRRRSRSALRAPERRRRDSAPCRAGPAGPASARAGDARTPAIPGSASADRRRRALRSSRPRATCGTRRRSAETGFASRASPRAPRRPCRALPGPSSSRAARSRSGGRP